MVVQISNVERFVTDSIFKAGLNGFHIQQLSEDDYFTPTRTEIIILATRMQNVLGEKGQQICKLTAVVQKRFGFPEGILRTIAQAESLLYSLLEELTVQRRVCYDVLHIMKPVRSQYRKFWGHRAKSTKFVDGLIIQDPVKYHGDIAVCHVLLRQGVLGIKVKSSPSTRISEQKTGKLEPPAMPQPVLNHNRVSLAESGVWMLLCKDP
ncbi:hypothetical protein K5549_011373 [Capra hircus]|uniref:KH type-2 domain-containing protein n=1 Tax=Capra hircus TaxID=9925 RepID=A0A452FJC3_CAPHI|nr:hypothetical protein K5549_011373 [Capra hircus]